MQRKNEKTIAVTRDDGFVADEMQRSRSFPIPPAPTMAILGFSLSVMIPARVETILSRLNHMSGAEGCELEFLPLTVTHTDTYVIPMAPTDGR